MTFLVVAQCDAPGCSNRADARPAIIGASPPVGWLHTDTTDFEDVAAWRHYDLCSAACHGQLLDAIASAQIARADNP